MNRRPERLADLLPGVVAELAARHNTTNGAPMTGRDNELLAVKLTRAQWRDVKQAIGDMWSGPQDVLFDELNAMDLEDGAA